VAAAGSEIGEFEAGGLAQALDLFPEFGCGAGVEDLQLEFAHFAEDGAGAQFHQDGERGDFPEHDLGPAAFKREFVLVAHAGELVGGQAQVFEPFHEVGAEHLALAVEGVAAQVCAFAAGEGEGADMVELFAQLALVDELGERDILSAVDQREAHLGVGLVAKDRLAHQQFVKVIVDQRADDRVDLPFVIPDACGDVHGRRPPCKMLRTQWGAGRMGSSPERACQS
jgi:hypothetical protein